MPQKDDKMKSLFADLGRPTRRGIRKCPKCTTVNGTRGSVCKNKDCNMIFRGKEVKKSGLLEACQLILLSGTKEKWYSVRIKDRGLEHRTFVKVLPADNDTTVDREVLELESDSELPEVWKCFMDSCNKNKTKDQSCTCQHVQAAKTCNSQAEFFHLKPPPSSVLNIPQYYLEELRYYFQGSAQLSVFRVSKMAFAVMLTHDEGDDRDDEMVHVLFIKPPRNESNVERGFHCSCFAQREQNREDASESTDDDEMCIHYYICISVLANDPALVGEFEQFIPFQNTSEQITSPMLGQLHLVSTDGKSVELDPTLSVEIMGDNMSLLESISAGDESSLANVQALESVLSDQIIVTNVEETLAFGDATVLEGLDDSDQQVCIFSSAHTTIQLSYPSQSDSHSQLFGNKRSAENKTFIDDDNPSLSPVKKRKITNTKTSDSTQLLPPTPTKHVSHGQDFQTDARQLLSGFDLWLAGVNDLINCTMHYRLSSKPEPLVYYIAETYFEKLRERITSVTGTGTKKRLPNQTVVFHRIERAPVGTYTKHMWKINSIQHLMDIFSCPTVSIKTKQDFIKSASGNFIEWVEPNPVSDDEKNQRILPVLHSTYLKCGRNYPSPAKESTPFVIEWVPDVLRASGLGELSLKFEFCKSEPEREVIRVRRR